MATKLGRIVELVRLGPKFAQVRLSGGDKVELPLGLWEEIQGHYPPNQPLVFVERRGRVFNYVQWAGTDAEASEAVASGVLRPHEYSASTAFRGGLEAAAARLVERQRTAYDKVLDHPWGAEAIARGQEANERELRIDSLFAGMNPFFCLSFETLIAYGFVSLESIDLVRQLVRSGSFPHRWWNPMMLRDLEILDTQEDALVRIGLWSTYGPAD